MNIDQSLSYLEELKTMGFILGLENIRNLLDKLIDKDSYPKFIHIAGTNGKGSTATYISSVLSQAGYRTGLYTSPSLIRFNERMKIDGVDIDDNSIARLLSQIRDVSEREHIRITAFEAETALALLYFAENKLDFAVIEVGLGGRLDATNVIENPLLSVITRIGLDHTDFLGSTIGEIAGEKAGIIKENRPVISYFQEQEAEEVIRDKSESMSSSLKFLNQDDVCVKSETITSLVFDYKDYKDMEISMTGTYQPYNASLALMALEEIRRQGVEISDEDLRLGMKKAIIPGRFQVLNTDPLIIVDGAHNPQGVEALVDSLRYFFNDKKHIFVFGTLRDKDYMTSIDLTLPLAKIYYTSMPVNERALSSIDLKNRILEKGGSAVAKGDIIQAIKAAIKDAEETGDSIIIFGSLYQAGQAIEYFTKEI